MEKDILDTSFRELPKSAEYVSLARRLTAISIDLVLVIFIEVIQHIALELARLNRFFFIDPSLSYFFLYKVVLEKQFGQTLGKKMVGIVVLCEDLREISWMQAFVRNYFYLSSALLIIFHDYIFYKSLPTEPVLGGVVIEHRYFSYILFVLTIMFVVDCFMMSKSARNQTLHDKWAKTVVIKNN